MFTRFLNDEAGKTSTEYMIMVITTALGALLVSLVAGQIIAELSIEINETLAKVEEVQDRGILALR